MAEEDFELCMFPDYNSSDFSVVGRLLIVTYVELGRCRFLGDSSEIKVTDEFF